MPYATLVQCACKALNVKASRAPINVVLHKASALYVMMGRACLTRPTGLNILPRELLPLSEHVIKVWWRLGGHQVPRHCHREQIERQQQEWFKKEVIITKNGR